MKKEYIVELSEKEADKLMEEHWVGEIVRCKDCKFRQSRVSRIIDGKECNLCEMVKGYKPAEWFCADGERRTDDALDNSKC